MFIKTLDLKFRFEKVQEFELRIYYEISQDCEVSSEHLLENK